MIEFLKKVQNVIVDSITAGDTTVGRVKITDGTEVADVNASNHLETVIGEELPAGTQNIGDVDIASSIPAGTNNIGDVDVATIAAGDNNIGNVDLASEIPAGTQLIGKAKITDGTEDTDVVTHADDDTDVDGLNGVVAASVLYGRIDADTVKPLRMDGSTHSIQTIDYAHHEIHGGSHYYLQGYTTLQDTDTLYVKLVTADNTKWDHFLYDINSTGILTSTFDEGATGGMAGGLRPTIHANNRNTGCWIGTHTGANNAAILTDSTKSWTVDALIGKTVFNTTDGSSAVITDNDATTVTATLAGGTGNDWDTSDTYEINGTQTIITSGVTVATSYIQRLENDSWGANGFKETIGGGSSRDDELELMQNQTYLRSFTSGAGANIVQFKASWYEHTDKG